MRRLLLDAASISRKNCSAILVLVIAGCASQNVGDQNRSSFGWQPHGLVETLDSTAQEDVRACFERARPLEADWRGAEFSRAFATVLPELGYVLIYEDAQGKHTGVVDGARAVRFMESDEQFIGRVFEGR
jgi:hypothetical protein